MRPAGEVLHDVIARLLETGTPCCAVLDREGTRDIPEPGLLPLGR